MEIIKTKCPVCEWSLEFPRDFDNLTCGICGSAFQVREYKGNINLSLLGADRRLSAALDEANAVALLDARLREIDEDIEKVSEEIEVLRSNEQIAPLQIGCAFFGMFGFVLLVLAFFATVGKDYFGGWLFYLALAMVILVSLSRLRRKMTRRDKLDFFREERARLSEPLAELERERQRLLNLKSQLADSPPVGDEEVKR